MVSYLGFFWPRATEPLPRAIIVCGVVLLLAAINVVGVRQAAIASDVFTIGKLIPLLIFIIAGVLFLHPQAYAFGPLPRTGAFSQSVLLLIFAFTGFEMAAIPAGEVRDPRRNLPRALLIAIAVVATTYILVQIVCVGTLPQLAGSTKPLADAAQNFMGSKGAAIISAGAIISISGNLNILVLSGARLPFAFAEKKQLPEVIARVHRRFFTPHVAIAITAAVLLVLTLQSSFVAALTISAIARLVTYGATCAALIVLRRRKGLQPPAFRLPAGPVIAVVALLLSVWLLANSTLKEGIQSLVAAAIGLLIYLSYRGYRRFAS